MIAFAMYVAPIGAFGAIAFTVGRFGPQSLLALGNLVVMFYVFCALFVLLVLWPIAWGFGIDMLRLVRYIGTELMIVVGTSSSESVFPRLHAKLRQLGVDPPVVALVLPTGYAFNHDGTCLYFATVSVFLAQALAIDLSIGQQLGLLAILLITSKGRRRCRRFGHRRPRLHARGHGNDPGGERRPDPGRASSAVVGLRAGQRARQRDCDAGRSPAWNGRSMCRRSKPSFTVRAEPTRWRSSQSEPTSGGAGRVVRRRAVTSRARIFEFRCFGSWEE